MLNPDRIQMPRVVSREEWLEARKAHLRNEKALTRMRDMVAAERRELPWVKLEKDYTFDTPNGPHSLAGLFGSHSQLVVYHFMWRWDLDSGCPSCSLVADHMDGANLHLKHRDVTLMAITRAPADKFAPYVKRLGWQFPWASSFRNGFNFDFGVSFTKDELATGCIDYNYTSIGDPKYQWDELPGVSVFVKDETGQIFHTYSAYARGLDILVGAFNWLDLTPKGRDEGQIMDWVKRHDEYEPSDTPSCCHS